MGILSFWTQSIVRLRPGTKTERGSEVPDWDNPKSLTIAECSVQPASSSLTQDGRVAGVTDGLTVYAPANADVKAGDRISYGGNIYTINGDPLIWPGPGRLAHIQLNLVRWRG